MNWKKKRNMRIPTSTRSMLIPRPRNDDMTRMKVMPRVGNITAKIMYIRARGFSCAPYFLIAIIWSDFDPKAKNIALFIAGLSNETVAIDHPVETDKNGEPVKVYLRKTLALDYAIGGDEKLRAGAGLRYKSKRWVMR